MNSDPATAIRRTVDGYQITIDHAQGHLCVEHDGTITWDDLQSIKNKVWGPLTLAIEVYPPEDALVKSGNFRHLWRLGGADFCPDLLGDIGKRDTLEARHTKAWVGSTNG